MLLHGERGESLDCASLAAAFLDQREGKIKRGRTAGTGENLVVIHIDLVDFWQAEWKQLLYLVHMVDMDSASAVVQQSGLGDDEAPRTETDDGNIGFIGPAKISESFLRLLEALWELSADDNEIVEFGVIWEGFMWRNSNTTARRYRLKRGSDCLPVTINLPAEIRLVGRVAQTFDKTGEG